MEFKYKVKNNSGEILDGIIEVPDERTAVDILHGKGYTVLSLDFIRQDVFSIDVQRLWTKPNNKDIVVFTRQLATLIDADMPILESLKTLAEQTEKQSFKEIIGNIAKYIEGGASLSRALSSAPHLFSPFYINLVKSGEMSGKLHDSLMYLASYLERSQELNSKIRGALAYPAFIVFALVVVTFIMTIWVLPNLLAIFKEVGVTDLPLTTRILIITTDFVNKYLYIIIFGLLAALGYLFYYTKTPEGREQLDRLKIQVPYFGIIARNFYLSRISEALSTLIKAGIPIIDTFHITANITGNSKYREIMFEAADSIKQGQSIAESFKNHPEVPPLFSSMVSIGERTGKLSSILEHIAKFYKTESETTIQSISQLLEPVMVMVLGLAVAILVSSILLPMYNLVGAI